MIVGDFTQLMIGIREQLSVAVAREVFAQTGEIALVAHVRADVALAHPASFCHVVGVL